MAKTRSCPDLLKVEKIEILIEQSNLNHVKIKQDTIFKLLISLMKKYWSFAHDLKRLFDKQIFEGT